MKLKVGQQVTLKTWTAGHLKIRYHAIIIGINKNDVVVSSEFGFGIYEIIERDVVTEDKIEKKILFSPKCDDCSGTTTYEVIV